MASACSHGTKTQFLHWQERRVLELGWVFGFLPGAAFLCPLADSKDDGPASLSGRTSLHLPADSQDLILIGFEEGGEGEGKLLVFGFTLKYLICR